MNQSKPRSQTSDGYSAVPPPEYPTKCDICVDSTLLTLILIFFGFIVYLFSSGPEDTYPAVQLGFVSVSLQNIRSNDSLLHLTTVANWKLGFAVDVNGTIRSMKYDNYAIKDSYVWVMCMSGNWTGTRVKTIGHDSGNLVNVGATLDTLLPNYGRPQLIKGLPLEFDAMLHLWYKGCRLDVVCENVTVAFSPNATEGVMTGGPRLCSIKIVRFP